MFPLDQIIRVGRRGQAELKPYAIIWREILFEVFQPMSLRDHGI